MLRDPVHLVALGFGTGLSPWAPGTCASLAALPFAWALTMAAWPWQLAVVAAAVGSGVWFCGESARRLDCHDHPGIVWDEIAAMLLVAVLIPAGALWLLAGFGLFRLFDIAKPWPIRDVDHRLGGGLGIILDDLVAAFYAAGGLRLFELLTSSA